MSKAKFVKQDLIDRLNGVREVLKEAQDQLDKVSSEIEHLGILIHHLPRDFAMEMK